MKTLKSRIKICAIACFLPAVFIAGRLFYLQTFRHEELLTKAEKRVYTQTVPDTVRGKILDNKGVVLAESLRTYFVAVSKKNVNKKDALFNVLGQALSVSKAQLNKLWNSKGNFFYVKKEVTPLEYEKLEELINKERVRGIEIEPHYTRIYPYDGIAQDILGATNSRNSGLSGIELMYEDELARRTKSKRVKKARRGGIIYDKEQTEFLDIADVYLTIDSLGQYYAESTLKKYAEEYKVKSAFAIVQDPETGHILAAASYPSLDGRSLPLQFVYEPGSTFKTIAVAAALDSGAIKPTDRFSMEDNKWKVDGITIRDHQKKPSLDVKEILEVSSNIGAAKISHGLGARTMYSYIKKFGFGVKSNVSFLGEPSGILREHTRWKPIDTAKAGYGYTVAVTGVQLVTAYSAIANGGALMQAHLIDKIKFANGAEEVLSKPSKIRQAISKKTSDQLKDLLVSVVENGTGKGAKVKGYSVAGKTGTTEKMAQDGKYQRSAHIASFCGFVPAYKPRFTILVVLDEPERALFGAASAKIFSEIAAKFLTLYAVEPDEEIR